MKLQISSIGENIVVRRLAFAKACCENSIVCGYVHFNKKVGVILKANCDSEATKKGAKDLLLLYVNVIGFGISAIIALVINTPFALIVAATFFICSTVSANAIAYTLRRLDDEILLD